MERQLELEEAQKEVKNVQKKANEAQKEVKELNQERVLMVQMMLKNGMSVSQIAKSISKSEEEIKKWISQPLLWWLFIIFFQSRMLPHNNDENKCYYK